jgi:hypothetical protein
MPRLIRQKSLRERWAAWLNPMDLLLWVSEEIQTRELDAQVIGTRVGVAANFVYLLASARSSTSTAQDDVFGESSDSDWLLYIVRPPSSEMLNDYF